MLSCILRSKRYIGKVYVIYNPYLVILSIRSCIQGTHIPGKHKYTNDAYYVTALLYA